MLTPKKVTLFIICVVIFNLSIAPSYYAEEPIETKSLEKKIEPPITEKVDINKLLETLSKS